jgi:cytochrome b561
MLSVTQDPGYGPTAKILHWLTPALLVVQYLLGWLMPDVKRDMSPGTMTNLHISFGLVILALVLARFAWRLSHRVAPDGSLPAWQRGSSEALHLLLYALAFVTTITGWTFASMRGWTIIVFGILPLPRLVAEGSPLGSTIGELHGTLIWVLLAAIGLHVVAALVHLVVYRDRIMQRMLPGAG